mmetsp:Transcript_42465/g.76134  ORF Transcript_42465/g.76134 Transcript_42465/m.76134 type:complete len:206 (-) Transcript_42465:607-1224(-)
MLPCGGAGCGLRPAGGDGLRGLACLCNECLELIDLCQCPLVEVLVVLGLVWGQSLLGRAGGAVRFGDTAWARARGPVSTGGLGLSDAAPHRHLLPPIVVKALMRWAFEISLGRSPLGCEFVHHWVERAVFGVVHRCRQLWCRWWLHVLGLCPQCAVDLTIGLGVERALTLQPLQLHVLCRLLALLRLFLAHQVQPFSYCHARPGL